MHVLLIRFGVIAGLVVLAALVLFAVAVHFRRRGRLGEAKQHAATFAQAAARHLDARDADRNGSGGSGGGLGGSALRLAARHLAANGDGTRTDRRPR